MDGCPRAKHKLESYAQELPRDALHGNVASRIARAFGLRKAPIIRETPTTKRFGIFQAAEYQLDPDWLVQLRKDVTDDDANLRWMVVDTGASTCATPNKDDFVGDVEWGNFGEIQTASKEHRVAIQGRGIVRWKAIDERGRVAYIECFLLHSRHAGASLLTAELLSISQFEPTRQELLRGERHHVHANDCWRRDPQVPR